MCVHVLGLSFFFFSIFSYNKCHITRGAYIDLVTKLLIIVGFTLHSKSLKQLVEDAKEDLISGQLKGLPLTNELPPVLLAFVDICNKFKVIDLPSFTQIIIQSWAHYSEYDNFFDQLLPLLDRLNKKEMCFVADKAMEKSTQEQAGVSEQHYNVHVHYSLVITPYSHKLGLQSFDCSSGKELFF